MFTVCPKCALTLVVTAADLRVAQGYVRCGRCLNVFNALTRLSEERPSAAPDSEAAAADTDAPEPSAAPPGQPPPSSLEETGEIEVELDASILVTTTSAVGGPPPDPLLDETAETPESPQPEEAAAQALREPDAAGESNAETAEVPAADPTALAATEEAAAGPTAIADTSVVAAAEPVAAAGSASAASGELQPIAATPDATAGPATADPERALAGDAASATDPVASEPATVPAGPPASADAPDVPAPQQAESPFELQARRPRPRLAWTLGAGALTIALALQMINHYRDALAASPALRGPLTTAYSALGVKLAPHWNVHAYDVRQLGASVAGSAAGEIVVRASVKNSASRAQPLPLLRVTLQDRFGNRIAARDVPPADYLPSPVSPGTLLAAGSRVDATMVFVDPGPQAVGFEIDACLRQRRGQVACAHGP